MNNDIREQYRKETGQDYNPPHSDDDSLTTLDIYGAITLTVIVCALLYLFT